VAAATATRRRRDTYPPPARRRLRVFTLDPTRSRLEGATTVLSVPWEPLRPGPSGQRIRVLDWDVATGAKAPAVDLDDPHLLAQDGLAADEQDRRFHQQMVYAVLASLLETLDQARGRRLQWSNVWRAAGRRVGPRPMPVHPHVDHQANAHYLPGRGLFFGAFQATDDLASGLFPGQWVYGCLSHDVVNHEAGHAFVHELRPLSLEPTGPDALAFHEGFADILALLQHFRLPGLLETQLVATGTALWQPGPFVEVAGELGRATGRGRAIRDALDDTAQPLPYDTWTQPHQRGASLVAALFEAFFAAYRQRIAPLLRLAGSPAPGQALAHDLVSRVADEARAAAATVLTMAVRAFDYLPPVDITFGDFVDAVVTADADLNPEDRDGFRRNLVESCRRRGIVPPSRSAGLRTAPDRWAALEPLPAEDAVLQAAQDLRDPIGAAARPHQNGHSHGLAWRRKLQDWARRNGAALGLDPRTLRVDGGNASFRWTQDGSPTTVVTARFVAAARGPQERRSAGLGGVRLAGGATVIADGDGRVRHVAVKPVPSDDARDRPGTAALERVLAFVADRASDVEPGQRAADPHWMRTHHSIARIHPG
jgi:hypothetical protein